MSAQPVKLNTLLQNLNTDFARVNNTNRSDQTFSRVLERMRAVMNGSFNPKASRPENVADNTGSKGHESIKLLRKFLMGTGVPLEKMCISHEGISSLKKFLNCCGFAKSDVERLINGLLNAGEGSNKKINVLELFSKLSELRTAVERKKKEPVLGASAIPNLEVALRRLGINARHLKKVLSEARTENGDIDLGSFLRGLKRIAKNTSPLHRVTPSDELAEAIKQALSHLGMDEENEKVNGAISLDRFVQLLEGAVSKTRRSHLPNQDVEKTIKHLIGEVIVDSEETDSKLQLKSHTAQKLIDDLLGSKNKQKGSNDPRIVSTGGEAEKILKILDDEFNDKKHAAMRSDNKNINISHNAAENRSFTESIKTAQQPAGSSSRSLPLYMAGQVSRQISRSIMEGKDHIRLRLKPPHLGTVRLEMVMKGNVLKLDVAAENQVTRELLLSHIQELKQSLVEQGIKLERMDVHTSYQFGESMKDARKEHNGKGHRMGGTSTFNGIGNGDEEIEAAISRIRVDAVLDLIA